LETKRKRSSQAMTESDKKRNRFSSVFEESNGTEKKQKFRKGSANYNSARS